MVCIPSVYQVYQVSSYIYKDTCKSMKLVFCIVALFTAINTTTALPQPTTSGHAVNDIVRYRLDTPRTASMKAKHFKTQDPEIRKQLRAHTPPSKRILVTEPKQKIQLDLTSDALLTDEDDTNYAAKDVFLQYKKTRETSRKVLDSKREKLLKEASLYPAEYAAAKIAQLESDFNGEMEGLTVSMYAHPFALLQSQELRFQEYQLHRLNHMYTWLHDNGSKEYANEQYNQLRQLIANHAPFENSATQERYNVYQEWNRLFKQVFDNIAAKATLMGGGKDAKLVALIGNGKIKANQLLPVFRNERKGMQEYQDAFFQERQASRQIKQHIHEPIDYSHNVQMMQDIRENEMITDDSDDMYLSYLQNTASSPTESTGTQSLPLFEHGNILTRDEAGVLASTASLRDFTQETITADEPLKPNDI